MGVTDGVVGIGTKSTEGQILGECHLCFHVNVKMAVVLILLHLQQCNAKGLLIQSASGTWSYWPSAFFVSGKVGLKVAAE